MRKGTMRKLAIGGIIESRSLTLIRVMGTPDKPGVASRLFKYLARLEVNVEFISSATDVRGSANLELCVTHEHGQKVAADIAGIESATDAEKVELITGVATIGVYGPHFRETPHIAAHLFSCLADRDVQVMGVSTSISTVACLVTESDLRKARDAIQDAFALP
jgi:aspartate kinase